MPLWWIKWTRFEFWPYWVFYFPFLFYGIFLAIKARSFTYFTAVNPGMNAGGLVGEGKMNMLGKIDTKYLPKTVLIKKNEDSLLALNSFIESGISFPCIIKPNSSERGIGVEQLHSETDLVNYLTTRAGDFLVQEFIDFEVELGVLYHRFPNGKDGITSVVQKEFLSITGDGSSTLLQLIKENVRARFRMEYLIEKFKNRLYFVLPIGEKMILEPIGNHNRGTAFLNANYLINKKLIEVFREISTPMDGFCYGRFDLKVKSIADLYKSENIRIVEVNGVESEPAHIYDPAMSIWKAYRDVGKHMKLIYQISEANSKRGVAVYSFLTFIKEMKKHFAQRKLYTAS